MKDEDSWRSELKIVVDLMRDVSRQTDPQAAAELYGRRIRETGMVPTDGYISVSRRGLEPPAYRITRSSLWKEQINPWTQKSRLPLFQTGLLGELLYSGEPQAISDLQSRLSPDDPALEYFQGMNMAVSMPQYDNGVAINMNVMVLRDPARFPLKIFPSLFLQSNLWGRSVLNLVLRQELKTAYDALDHELKQVGELQRSLLPSELPTIEGIELAVNYRTSARAGGDYYDLFNLSNGRWGLLIADVSGHGPPAAVIMAITHAIAHLHTGDGTAAALLSYINRSLVARYTNGNGTFVTAFYGVYDPAERTLTYARAGHNPPRIMRNGVVGELDSVGGLPLGLWEDRPYEERVEKLAPGDALLFYTDGVTEARDAAGEMFGIEPLDKALRAAGSSAENLLSHVLDALNTFAGGVPPGDDQTLLTMVVR
ncbi:MAG: serine/threonine-protein phosphatase [Planctomycetota bacterium]|nr:serine/threonine-protein phosphatase [Planctomycetota bacterium]